LSAFSLLFSSFKFGILRVQEKANPLALPPIGIKVACVTGVPIHKVDQGTSPRLDGDDDDGLQGRERGALLYQMIEPLEIQVSFYYQVISLISHRLIFFNGMLIRRRHFTHS
jgi:hypothetical protein